MIEAWGRFVGRRPWTVLLASLVIITAASAYGFGVFGALSNGGFFVPGSESYRADATMREAFPERVIDVVAVYQSDTLTVDDPAFRTAVEAVVDRVEAKAPGTVVQSFYDTQAPALVSEDRHATQVLFSLAGDSAATDDGGRLGTYRTIEDDLVASGLTTHIGGGFALYDDVNSQVKVDITRAETISMPLVFILSFLIFGSIAAAVMPTLVGGVAVVGAFSLVRAITTVTDVSVFAINVITMMGMGLAIDYALFIVSRFREELDTQGGDVGGALARTMATAGRTVFFSGIIVTASLSSLLIFPLDFLKSMGYGGMAAVLVAMVAAWGLRLGWHIARRSRGHGEDPRYAAMLGDAGFGTAVRKVFLVQGLAMWLISLPVQVGPVASLWSTPVVWIGVAAWAVGVTFEAVGDAQLAAYKRQPRETRPPVLDRGLWAWTRHPNYFGDAVAWWGIWLVGGLASGWLPGLLTLIAPVAMTHFLRNVTGAELLERSMMQRPAFREYAQRVPLFVPRPPRR